MRAYSSERRMLASKRANAATSVADRLVYTQAFAYVNAAEIRTVASRPTNASEAFTLDLFC